MQHILFLDPRSISELFCISHKGNFNIGPHSVLETIVSGNKNSTGQPSLYRDNAFSSRSLFARKAIAVFQGKLLHIVRKPTLYGPGLSIGRRRGCGTSRGLNKFRGTNDRNGSRQRSRRKKRRQKRRRIRQHGNEEDLVKERVPGLGRVLFLVGVVLVLRANLNRVMPPEPSGGSSPALSTWARTSSSALASVTFSSDSASSLSGSTHRSLSSASLRLMSLI